MTCTKECWRGFPPMILSFTGTRQGMTPAQHAAVTSFFSMTKVESFHHGACVGADEQAHEIAVKEGVATWRYPAGEVGSSNRAECPGAGQPFCILNFLRRHQKWPPPLVRNHWIVDAGDWLLVAPSGPEVLRSGTWATVRYAKRCTHIHIVIIWPDGSATDGRQT